MKRYLGDGLYVDVENGMLKLTAENGISATDTIYLEPHVYQALVEYVATLAVDDSVGFGTPRTFATEADREDFDLRR